MVAGLATAEELAKGASIAQEGLEVPPPRFPAPSALASRPSPANVTGPGELLTFFVFFCCFDFLVSFGLVLILLLFFLRRCF